VIIPVFNEERRIEPTLIALSSYLKAQPWRSRIIVVDNGCVDRTTSLADRLDSSEVPIKVIGCKSRGKGAAVRKGILSSHAPLVGFCDADLSTPVEMIGPAVAMMESGRPAVIGSRRCPGAHYAGEQSLGRRLGGAAFRRIARSVAQDIADTQCGFKFFHADVARALFSRSVAEGFAFDVEIVGLAHVAGVEITELPVRWSDNAGSTFRPFTDGHGSLRELMALRARFKSMDFSLSVDEALAADAA
jgi:dolichyl-phosphate beta-glucosyltransferase